MPTLGDLASLIRSKNAGPFLLTFDIMFGDQEAYDRVKRAGVINREVIGTLYQVPLEDVKVVEYDPGLAIKATIPRPIVSGDPGDTDIYGAQQHAPIVNLQVRGGGDED